MPTNNMNDSSNSSRIQDECMRLWQDELQTWMGLYELHPGPAKCAYARAMNAKELVTVPAKPYKRYVATKPSGLKWSSLGATVKYWLAY